MERATSPDNIPSSDETIPQGERGSRDIGDQKERWLAIQARFVDEPRESVEKADSLLAEVIEDVTRRVAAQRRELESKWNGDEEVSTEDLRRVLQEYRSFFEKLLVS
jgi:hypothetical protein